MNAQPTPQTWPVRVGRLLIDAEQYEVFVDDQPVALTYMEYQLLFEMCRARGGVVSYDRLADTLWREHPANARRRLAVLVSRLRSRLGTAGEHIATIQRVGYRLAEPNAPRSLPRSMN
ncbi:MAG: winged helix-turn-helix domain-containing protein [Dehalococcoidia bacterium]